MKNLHFVLWVMDQNHVCDLSIWVSPSCALGPIRRVMYFPCLTAGALRFLVPPPPARCVGLPYGWLTAEARQTLSGLLRPAYARCERVGYPHDSRGGSVSSHAEASPACLHEGVLVPSLFSQHHRLCHPHSDDLLLTQPQQGFTHVHPSALHLARVRFVAKLPLRHYSWLHTLPLPGTHAGIGDRLGHEPGGVLFLLTHNMRFAHRTMPSKNITSWSLKKTTGSIEGRPPPA